MGVGLGRLSGLLGAVGNTVAGVVDGITGGTDNSGSTGGMSNSGGTSGTSGTSGTVGGGDSVTKSALAIAPVPAAVVGAVLLGSKAKTRSGKKMRKG